MADETKGCTYIPKQTFLAMPNQTEVVVLGGSFAGISAAKTILEKLKKKSVHLTLVSPSTHSYFNVAAPLVVVETDKIQQVFFPIIEVLDKYAKDAKKYTFIHGSAESVDFRSNNVLVKENNASHCQIAYDVLVIATGARAIERAFKSQGNFQETIRSIEDLNAEIQRAHTIVTIGGGPTGVEMTSEIAHRFKNKKKITLITGSKHPLVSLGEKAGITAEEKLKQLGVKVVNNIKSKYTGKLRSQQKLIILDDNNTYTADIVIQASILPNSEFLPSSLLDKRGYLITDEFFRLKHHPNVIGLGDILSIGTQSVVDLKYFQLPVFDSFVKKDVFKENSALRPYASHAITFVPIAGKYGVGTVFGWSVPSYIVHLLRGDDYMVSKGGDFLG